MIKLSKSKKLSDSEYEQLKADRYNASEGELNADGYDCRLCKNKGFVAEVHYQDYSQCYDTVYVDCKCRKIHSALRRLHNSGLKDVVKSYAFDTYAATEEWQRQMKDTIGKASQLTGGYGNSYAATAGNLAYQASLQQLNDVVPELYQLAYNRHQDQSNELKNKYAMLTDKEATEYGRYQDALADYYNQYGLLSSEEDKLYNRDYNNWMNQENAKQNIAQSDRDYQYKVNRDSVADKQWQQQFDATEDSREFQEWLSKQNLQLNQDQFTHNKNMDFNNMELANKQYQLELGKLGMEREEHEAAMEQYEYAKKNGGFTAENVKALSSEEIPEIIQMYVEDKNAKGLEIFLYDLYQTGRISKEGYEIYSAMYNLEEEKEKEKGQNNVELRNTMTNNFFDFLRGR